MPEPVRYAKKRLQTHPLLKGTRLAAALKSLTRDHKGTDIGNLARSALIDPTQPVIFHGLKDALIEVGSPLAEHYNWEEVQWKLHLDHHLHQGLQRLTNSLRRQHDAAGIALPADRNASLYTTLQDARAPNPDERFPLTTLDTNAGQRTPRDLIIAHARRFEPGLHVGHIDESLARLSARYGRRLLPEDDTTRKWMRENATRKAVRSPDENVAARERVLRRSGVADGDPQYHRQAITEERAQHFARGQQRKGSTTVSDFAASYERVCQGEQPVKYAAQVAFGYESLNDDHHALLAKYHETGNPAVLGVMGDYLQENARHGKDDLVGRLLSRVGDGFVEPAGQTPGVSGYTAYPIVQYDHRGNRLGWVAQVALRHPEHGEIRVNVPASREEMRTLNADDKLRLLYGGPESVGWFDDRLANDPDTEFYGHSPQPERYSRGQKAAGGVAQALRLLRSKNQQRVRDVAGQIAQRLALGRVKMRDAVTNTASPVAAVAMAVYHGGDEERANQAAAYLGHLLQLPASSAFHIKPDGGDSLYKMTLPLAPDKASQLLQSYGIRRSVLSPTKQGTEVIIHDPGHYARDRVESLAAAAGVSEVQHSTGATVHFGDDEQQPRANATARKSYRDAINRGQ